MSRYKYILSDWDGTIARTLDIWFNSLKQSLILHGHDLDDLEIGANYTEFKRYFESQGHIDVDEILDKAVHYSNEAIPKVELYADAANTLSNLHASCKMALVTTSPHSVIDPLLIRHEFLTLFDVIIRGDDVSNIKPHPEPLEKALELLEAKLGETIMIGDSDADICAANSAGIDSILFYPPSHEKFHNFPSLKLLQPTYVLNDWREIGSVIAKI